MKAHHGDATAIFAEQDAAGDRSFGRAAQDFLARAVRAYIEWTIRRATVRILGSLDDRALHDIGMSRSEIHSVVYGEPGERLHVYRRTWE